MFRAPLQMDLSNLAAPVRGPVYLQRGGIVTRPTLAVIGERGPEAVVPIPYQYQRQPVGLPQVNYMPLPYRRRFLMPV
jgi:hypothetical protein